MPSDTLMVTWGIRAINGPQKAKSFLAGAEKKQHITVQFYTGSYKVAALEEM